jgi:hypothetical protein
MGQVRSEKGGGEEEGEGAMAKLHARMGGQNHRRGKRLRVRHALSLPPEHGQMRGVGLG